MRGRGVQVRAALEKKIARERVGIEISKCFDGPQPLQAAAYLLQIHAFAVVFQVLLVPITLHDSFFFSSFLFVVRLQMRFCAADFDDGIAQQAQL
jgi:tRNA nucleotidyltransferase/poly(A) polymerase